MFRRATAPAPSTFSSLATHNFRLFIATQVFAYTGSDSGIGRAVGHRPILSARLLSRAGRRWLR